MNPPGDATPDALAPGSDDLLARVQRRLFAADTDTPSSPGRRRYELEEKLGEGGMGVVWRARDPALDRPLAVKVMRTASPEMHARLLAEGRALARLSHPHVVQIYEVDDRDGEVSLVMEYIHGQTLRAWARGRPWQAVVRVCVEAGEGLAAAHACGLAHRDFKPDNVLVDSSGRAKVLDFGLARRLDDPTPPQPGRAADPDAPADLTRTGALVGTPAYMAPEQARGRPGGAAADQFSFCVSVYELLYGVRPFAGAGRQLRDDREHGRRTPPPLATAVPPRVLGVLLRGLDPDPSRRWPNMPALLHALTHDPSHARARRRRLGALLLAAAALGSWSSSPGRARCSGAADKLVGVWDEPRRDELRRTIEATGAPFARESAAAVIAALDEHAARWVRGHTDACEATHVRGEQSGAALDLRMRCLAGRLVELRSTVDVLRETDARSAPDVLLAAQRLPGVDTCADPTALASAGPPPALPRRGEVERAHARLAQVRALRDAGRLPEGHRLAEAVLHAARELGHPPLLAAAELHAGELATRQGHHAQGEALLLASYYAAERLGMTELARDASWRLADNVGYAQERVAEGERWVDVAEAKTLHLGDPVVLGRLQSLRATLASTRNAPAEALRYDRAAVAQLEQALGPGHIDVATARMNLGISLLAADDPRAASAALNAALATLEPSLGPQHPRIAALVNELGKVAATAKEWEKARAHFERALAVWSRAYEPDHPDIALALKNLAVVEHRTGRPALALQHLARALAAREARLGATHSETIATVQAIATIQREQGRLDEALRGHTRVLAVREQKFGPADRTLLPPLLGLAQIHEQRGELASARRLAARAEAVRATLGVDAQFPELAALLVRLRSP